jgi:hypothetical protein
VAQRPALAPSIEEQGDLEREDGVSAAATAKESAMIYMNGI